MPATKIGHRDEDVIAASWQRCERQHGLVRETAYPILRLQSSEVTPRLEEMVERLGGHRGIFRQLAEIALNAGQCLVLSDTDRILVSVESKDNDQSVFERYGIALGSCWNEKIAGTNGVAIAMAQSKAFTVCGTDHYFSKLHQFACTAVPLFDAENQMIGAINLAGIDRGNAAEYVFAQKLLDEASGKIQRALFEQHFRDVMIVSVSGLAETALMPADELVAIDEEGVILGATARVHLLARKSEPSELIGKSFEAVFGTDTDPIDRVPERVLSTRSDAKLALSISLQQPNFVVYPGRGWQPSPAKKKVKQTRRRLSPTLRLLAMGSEAMAAVLEQAQAHFERALPFTVEGESGTGKSALIDALHSAAHRPPSQMVTIDCALLDHQASDRNQTGAIFEQARVIDALDDPERGSATLVLENVDEMPGHDQARLRNLLTALEAYGGGLDHALPSSAIRIVATCRRPLKEAVEQGRFRDDLYFLLGNARLELPPLRARERPEDLARSLASQLAGSDVDLTDEAIDAIGRHNWPGNVRELRSALREALIAGDGGRISLLDLRASSAFSGSRRSLPESGPTSHTSSGQSYDEKTMLLDALHSAAWNVSRAARNLGIGRATIHRKMKQHGITRAGPLERAQE